MTAPPASTTSWSREGSTGGVDPGTRLPDLSAAPTTIDPRVQAVWRVQHPLT